VQVGKTRHYEPSSRVPLILRGPGVPEGKTVNELAVNADLAPTILGATGASPGVVQDGRSLIELAKDPRLGRGHELVIETTTYTAIRTARYKYVEHHAGDNDGAVELYDLEVDPFELHSRHADRDYADVRRALAARLAELRGCAGESCLRPDGALDLVLRAKAKQRARRIKAEVGCGQVDCTVELGGRGKVPRRAAGAAAAAGGRKLELKPKRVEVAAGATETVRLRFRNNRKAVKRVERLLERGTKARKRAKIVVEATATGGGDADTASRKVKLRR
jgi:hypothetical protein